MNKEQRRHRLSLTVLFSIIVFCTLLVSVLLAALAVFILVHTGLLSEADSTTLTVGQVILSMTLISILLGAAVAFVAVKIPLKPINQLIEKMNSLASGDFQARIRLSPLLESNPTFSEMAASFNKMAQELENTQMLRGDFINNFSHEFKTPIVSIAGFAKLLRRGNLTEQQKQEYMAIIEEESLRLSYMATNVLNLTRIENQAILSGVTEFNLSEQIRSCVLLLEDKWEKKNLDFQLEFAEYTISANEELLKQVWINLLDNAIKFSPQTGEIHLGIREAGDTLRISVRNYGSDIPPESQKKIFLKFYQADESHASQGNGIGLAIVKRVVELHRGQVSVESGGGVTTFTVELPKCQ